MTVQDIQKATHQDTVLSKVYRYVQGGWPSQVADELRPYRDCQTELTTESGYLMWGIWMIIPKSLQVYTSTSSLQDPSCNGSYVFAEVDVHSKWLEVEVLKYNYCEDH